MDTSTLKAFAQRLRLHLKPRHISLKHGQALDLVAAVAGLRNWPEVNAFPERVAVVSPDDQAYQRLVDRIASRYKKTLSLEELRQALETPLPDKRRTNDSSQKTAPKELESAGGKVLKYVEIDEETGEPTGRSASFLGVDFEALQYSDLIDQRLRNKIVIPLRWKNARVLESSLSEISVDKLASGNAVLESTYSSLTIGLVKGGWLPSGVALQDDMIVMPDRCTISELGGRFRDGKKTDDEDKDFLDLFADKRVRINPLLYALEGNLRKNPTPDIVEQQFDEACAKIKSSLPLAELVPAGKSSLRGIVGIISNTREGMVRKQDFLIRLAPKFRSPIGARRLPVVWNEVLTTADDCGVPRRSLVVLAALSAISVPNGKSPARKLLKLTESNYSEELAYNALADLRSLEILMHLFAVFPNERVLLCTGDKDLALFWAGIRASDFDWRGDHLHFKLSPVEALLPNVTPGRQASYFDEEETAEKVSGAISGRQEGSPNCP